MSIILYKHLYPSQVKKKKKKTRKDYAVEKEVSKAQEENKATVDVKNSYEMNVEVEEIPEVNRLNNFTEFFSKLDESSINNHVSLTTLKKAYMVIKVFHFNCIVTAS